jgi:hypothetical protein
MFGACMMGKIGIKAAGSVGPTEREHAPPQQPELSEEDRSKDGFFVQIAEIAEAMMARHGKDFAIGAFVLAAKFVAEGKPLINRANGGREAAGTVKPV